jgi:hypothetical protein
VVLRRGTVDWPALVQRADLLGGAVAGGRAAHDSIDIR